ncbi:MAG TPA: glycosyltransferase, partial [bacterium]|nr:glycosyltransferase [bacterium]
MTQTRPHISVVVPLYNEESSISELHHLLTETLDSVGSSYEIIYVDDGSRDRTLERLLML